MADIVSSRKDYKKYFFISAISLVLTIIIIATVYFLITPPGYKQYYNKEYTQCMIQNELKYAILMAKKTGSEKYCIKDGKTSEICLAYARKTPELYCNGESEGSARDSCYAKILQNPTKCPQNNTWCLAYASNNPEYCQKLEDEPSKQGCIMSLTQNAEYWISAETERACKDNSLFAAAAMLKDERPCNKISEDRKEECINAARLKVN